MTYSSSKSGSPTFSSRSDSVKYGVRGVLARAASLFGGTGKRRPDSFETILAQPAYHSPSRSSSVSVSWTGSLARRLRGGRGTLVETYEL